MPGSTSEIAIPTGDASTTTETDGRLASVGKKRTRTGCLNCRRKRRKCDETKPRCEGCQNRREACEWGLKISFRPENAHSMGPEHPSMQAAVCAQSQNFQIINVTSEVVRDYYEETAHDDVEDHRLTNITPTIVSNSTPKLVSGTQTVLGIPSTISRPTPLFDPEILASSPRTATLSDVFLSPQWSDSVFEDGIFLPGSEYQELHAALRSKIIDTARSTLPSRSGTPETEAPPPDLTDGLAPALNDGAERLRPTQITPEQEYILWQNYIHEISPWMDKFDNGRHFELVMPVLARSHPHVKFALLALSARQLERKSQSADSSCSLALYSHAIHLLSPALQQRTDVVLASCVVLSVLEMMSCSPKAWRRHLDGCAALIQSLGITGVSGGLGQAAFWIFARMETWGSVSSLERPLTPLDKWIGAGSLDQDVSMLEDYGMRNFDMYANHISFLCGRVVDLLCRSGKWEQRPHRPFPRPTMDPTTYLGQWTQLFSHLEKWYQSRPEEMQPILTISTNVRPGHDSSDTAPFQTLLYGNGPAVAGNQMYHTAALLMLKYKPAGAHHHHHRRNHHEQHFSTTRKPHSLLWHARQICAISLSNRHHGCWTNSIQPLWLAGQHMSHPSEHRAILDLYARIERETGWATRWRADDLTEYWGELDG